MIRKINFKQPKYIFPLVVFIPLCALVYFVMQTFGGILAASEGLHHEVHQRTQGNEYHQREDVLGLFEIDFSDHGWSLF